MSLIAIQERYIERVIAANNRWSHRKDGGHAGRSRRAAAREAKNALSKLGYTSVQTNQALKDAYDMAILELAAE
ncbi:MAG: hypothetical protein U0835_00010 [Isosphaeraceae bacterium]